MRSSRNVIMFHSVGSYNTDWKENWLSVDTHQFEVFCKYLSTHNYKTHFLNHWYNAQNEKEANQNKDLYLTFDDGYLDNLLIAFPIMEKYGIKGTIFINPEFVDPTSGIRTLESHPSTLGFLNWDEILFLKKSGVFDIQSHSMSHNYYFSSDKLIDIHDGGDKYHWLGWISKPERKPFWLNEAQGSFTLMGTPVFEYGRALGVRRYFPDETFVEKAIELYKPVKDFSLLRVELEEIKKQFPGRYEMDSEMVKRFQYELFDSKRILEEKLGCPIHFLCWPGGGYNEASLQIAIDAGYKASTIASKEGYKCIDNFGKDYKRIVRFGMNSNIRKGQLIKKSRIVKSSFSRHLVWSLLLERRSFPIYFLARANNLLLKFF